MADIRESVNPLADALASLDSRQAIVDGVSAVLVQRVAALEQRVLVLEKPPLPVPPPVVLTPSGSVSTTAANQVIEGRDITGKVIVAHGGVIIRNCRIKHPGDNGIYANTVANLTIEDVEMINTSAASGLNPNPAEHIAVHLNSVSGTVDISRLTVRGAAGIYAHRCAAKLNINRMEGRNIRGPVTPLRGQLIQFNQCTGGGQVEDFSCENDPQNSWPEDVVNFYFCTGSYIFRRGLLDGCNSPSGVGFMIQDTPSVLVEDVDCVNQGNGAFSSFGPKSSDNIFRRCNARDMIAISQGRGVPTSGALAYHSWSGAARTKFEQCKYFNIVSASKLAWDQATMAVKDFTPANFTARAPVRNVFGWST